MERTMDEVVETLRKAKDRGKQCSLLIGAGCSVKAGIPTAAGFVEVIQKEYPRAYERAAEKTYPKCMAELSFGDQRDLIAGYVDQAKINWAHIAIAQLIKNGFVDRILTTNFDLLVVRACALVGMFPAVYDFAASQAFSPADIPGQAVFYLHGQRTGFILINTEEQFNKHAKLLAPVFEDAGRGRVWLVVGYSGENDPVFDHLANVYRFDNNLYWIGYQDAEPAKHVRERLLVEGKYAFYVKGFDADTFFVTLARKLDCFPPDLVRKPFSHLDCLLEMVTSYTLPRRDNEVDILRYARKLIQDKIKEDEQAFADTLTAHSDFLAGDYEKVVTLKDKYRNNMAPDLADAVSWAFVMQGNNLFDQAQTKTGEEADRLWALAGEKYAAALAIKLDDDVALYNWGATLDTQARTKTGEEADRLWALAGEKYAAALAIKPDDDETLNNWGNALYAQAGAKTGEEADRLWALAGEKYAAALAIKPDKHEALYNWGSALDDQARTKTGEEADRLWALAGEKYAAALAVKPDLHEALNNWGLALAAQARTKTGEEADRLWALAGEKYTAALAVKPDMHEALYNWGSALDDQARTKTGEEADRLFILAKEKLSGAEAISPGSGAYDLACVSALQGAEAECRDWLEKSRQSGELPAREHLEKDSDLDSVHGCEWFKEFLARL